MESQEQDAGELRVRLHPFLHQVSGSSLMFNFDNSTICKPLLTKEHHFYNYLPETLREFTAEYKGCITVQFEEQDDGTVMFFGIVPADIVSSLNLSAHEDNSQELSDYVDYLNDDEIRLRRSGSIEMNEGRLDRYDKPGTKLETGRRLNKGLTLHFKSPGVNNRFILLENLVSPFKQPSVLDLKMGTRTHGDDDPDAKKESKKLKCKSSTSTELGVRVHGMQKYDASNGKFETLDKYEGLKLSVDEFKRKIVQFLHDGKVFRQELVSPIYDRLKRFHDCLSQQDTFRFYSCSLLIIYEGDFQSPEDVSLVKVKAIDFAHTTYESYPDENSQYIHTGPDLGYLLGLKTLIDIFKGMQSE
ncbi:inositol hexakisphosphate kinase 2-like [Watersipora subatra]|uniref:inositol hexakisphosphate kinase 2-like n=1 Tax=Watersipora subatra TaxID=2589382 RepID=UPI00355C7785